MGAMSNQWILVDGYSVLHAWPRFATRRARQLSLLQKREALVRALRQYADQRRRRVTVVFDGYAAKHKPEVAEPDHGVEVLFSEKGKTADDLIERLVGQAEQRAKILVVTSDNMERRTVESLGAQSMAAEVFEAEVDAALRELAVDVRTHSRRRQIGHRRDDWGDA
ncbi:MAG TPA: NYN domain-containing protein [Verrucomicrobiae bacterium]|nr:NYN domain-containing protein [Verrucomicrobiae bacterium]